MTQSEFANIIPRRRLIGRQARCEMRTDPITYSEVTDVRTDGLDNSGAIRAGYDAGSKMRELGFTLYSSAGGLRDAKEAPGVWQVVWIMISHTLAITMSR